MPAEPQMMPGYSGAPERSRTLILRNGLRDDEVKKEGLNIEADVLPLPRGASRAGAAKDLEGHTVRQRSGAW